MGMGTPRIAGYGELSVLGQGGFATVYRARQLAFDREVAVKVVDRTSTNDRTLGLFMRECRAVGGLSWHPHVVPVYAAGQTEEGHPYLAMELLPGGSLGDRMASGPLPADDAVRYGAQVADAVAAAHEVGVLHRDLKPANVLIDRRGTARLADFGIARVKGSETTSAGVMSGTLAYIAPEILEGERAAETTDVYGIGMTITALVLGKAPFAGDPADPPFAVIARVTTDELPDLRRHGLRPALADLVARCTARDPALRPTSAAEVMDGLLAPAPSEPSTVAVTPPPPIGEGAPSPAPRIGSPPPRRAGASGPTSPSSPATPAPAVAGPSAGLTATPPPPLSSTPVSPVAPAARSAPSAPSTPPPATPSTVRSTTGSRLGGATTPPPGGAGGAGGAAPGQGSVRPGAVRSTVGARPNTRTRKVAPISTAAPVIPTPAGGTEAVAGGGPGEPSSGPSPVWIATAAVAVIVALILLAAIVTTLT